MRRMMIALTGALLAAGLLSTVALQAQAQSAELSVLDRNKATVTQFVDGDLIQLKIKLPSRAPQPTRLTFAMDQATTPIAECTVPANGESCETAPLASLGWAWDKDGQPRRERTIRALADGTAVATAQVRISPRPVVLAHGFIGSADAWSAYLGPDGFLGQRGYPHKARSSWSSHDEASARRLWEVSEELTGAKYSI